MLTRADDPAIDVPVLQRRPVDGRNLHEIWPGACYKKTFTADVLSLNKVLLDLFAGSGMQSD
jgi:hypothetical protein